MISLNRKKTVYPAGCGTEAACEGQTAPPLARVSSPSNCRAGIKRGGLPLRIPLLLGLVRSTLLTACLLVPGLGLAQTFTDIGASLTGVRVGSAIWGDYDNDGDLDIILTGEDNTSTEVCKIYRNDSGSFVEISAGLPGVWNSSVAWGDYDNDGDLDILFTGYGGSLAQSRVYRNDGGSFTDIGASLYGVSRGAVAWGDYDNDGDLDILLTGERSSIVTKLYRNEYRSYGDGAFTFWDVSTSLTGVKWSSVAWGDYDNDGDLDILLTGDDGTAYISKVYRNDGSNFTDISAGLQGVWGYTDGAVAWGDYDSDGDLDILMMGEDNAGTHVSKVYRNDSGSFTDINAGLMGVAEGSVAWGDCDNDGDLDILLTGSHSPGWYTIVYRNEAGSFIDIGAGLMGVGEASAAWGDYDNDGDLDILLTGYYGGNRIAKIYRNNSAVANTVPTAPTGLSISVSGNITTMNWNKSTDSQTAQNGLTYNLRVGTGSSGVEIASPMANVSTGYRKVPQLGNTNQNISRQIKNLTDGTYYWSVQAVDAGFMGSAFATEQTFTVDTTPPAAPANLTGTPGDQQIDLHWTPNIEADLANYYLYRNTANDSLLAACIDTLGKADTSTTDAGLTNGTTYWYWVSAVDSAGNESGLSSGDSATPDIFTDILAPLINVASSSVAWGDYDNDGDLDILLTGQDSSGNAISRIYGNDNGSFADIGANLGGAYSSSATWGDYDNDGDLDIMVTGQYSTFGRIRYLYRNDEGTFTDVYPPISAVSSGSVAWGDFDKDGDLDLLITGYTGSEYIARVYRNHGGTFAEIFAGLTAVSASSVAWGDYDNDGDLDILLTGYSSASSSRVAKLYRNDGGQFTEVSTSLTGVSHGAVAWGDYDNDGDLDILLAGTTGSGSITKVYQNDGGLFTIATSLVDVSNLASATWGDYDNDGDLDILLTGLSSGGRIAKIYRNDAGSFVDISAPLEGVDLSSATWGDYDNDGDLDILLTGTTNGSYSGAVARIYRNNSLVANSPAAAPTSLASAPSGADVSFSWAAATDNETPSAGLSYNLRVGTTPGGDEIMSAHGNTTTGYRSIPALGNAQQDTGWTLHNLPDGTYYWSVQAVDGGYTGSAWAPEQSFVITGPPPLFEDISAGISGVHNGTASWGDYDNDGDLDVLITGDYSTWGPYPGIAYIYRNDVSSFVYVPSSLEGVENGATAWGDYDGDGDLDILLTGYTNSGPISKIYRNDITSFVDINAPLPGVGGGSVAWGDYDNDGDLDILLTGTDSLTTRVSKIYRNDAGSFTEVSAGLIGVTSGAVAWGDYDNDGDLDILLAGYDNSNYKISKVYWNDNGTFTDISANLAGVYNGASAAWGDYDNDGDLDILLSGMSSSSRLAKIYRNDSGNFIDITAPLHGVDQSSTAWGDYDNDGDLDIVLTGTLNGFDSGVIAKVYRNDGGSFTDILADLANVYSSTVAWGDYDNDGDLDILLTGWNVTDIFSIVYRNNSTTANTQPSAPPGLAATAAGDTVTFSWNSAADTQTPSPGLNYNLRVGTAAGGNQIMPSHANAATGYRRIPALGNANHDTSWTISGLPDDTYYWSVQAVDAGFMGSPFAAEQSFILDSPPAAPSSLVVTDSSNGTVALKWDRNTEADLSHYVVYQSTTAGFTPSASDSVAMANKSDSTAAISGLHNGTTYYFRLAAVDSAGNGSAYASQVRATPQDLIAPAAPTNLTAAPGNRQVTLSWAPNAEADLSHYRLYRHTADDSSAADQLDSVLAPDALYTDATVGNDTTYWYWVSAVDSAGNESILSVGDSALPVNYPPAITSLDAASATEDVYFSYHALATDPEDSTVTFTFDLRPTWLDAAPDSVFGVPLEGATDTSFRVIASDGELFDTLVVTVTVSPVNEPPQITSPATANATEDEYFSYRATATDPEDSTVTFTFDLRPGWLDADADSAFGTPLEGAVDTSFRVIASDGELYDTLVVAVTVNPVNEPPEITSLDIASATEDVYFSYHALATDPEDSTIVFTFEPRPTWLDAAADSVFGTPLEGAADTSFRVIASDGELTDTLVVSVTVSPVNDPPEITSLDIASATEDVYFSYHALATDPEDSTITWTFDLLPTWLSWQAGTDSTFGIPLEGAVDTSFRVIASDGELYDTLVVTVTVSPMNEPPAITSLTTASATEDIWFSYRALATDPEDSTVTFTFDLLPIWLSWQAGTDSTFGTPLEGAVDTSFRVIASDGELYDTLLVAVTVSPVNEPPVITSALTASATEDVYFSYHATATDPEDSTITFAFDLLPSWLEAVADSAFGTPSEGVVDTSFRVIVSDGELADTLVVSVSVQLLWPVFALSVENIDFGDVLVSRDSTQSCYIYNTGNDTLLIHDLSTNSPVFTVEGGTLVAPGDSLAIQVSCTPADTGSVEAVLTITTDDPDREQASVDLSGRGVAPEPYFSNQYYSLVIESGDEIGFDLPISNRGTYSLDYEIGIDAFFVNFDWLTAVPMAGNIPAGESGLISVSVAGSSNLQVDEYVGNLIVTTHASGHVSAFAISDSVQVQLRVLADGLVASGGASVTAGDAPPIDLVDPGGDSLGLTLDFVLSSGGSVNAISADVPPPIDSTTTVNDPNGSVTDPVYADFYWEIMADFTGGFLVDITFDYRNLVGVHNHSKLRLAKRSSFAGIAIPWTLLETSVVRVDSLKRQITADDQSAFSQWTVVSDASDNPFADILAPSIAGITADPTVATAAGDVVISAQITDESNLQSVQLFYLKGGEASFTSTAMALDNADTYVGTIPGQAITLSGIAYYLRVQDVLEHASNSDTASVQVKFAADALSTVLPTGFYKAGFPKDKWRLVSMPAQLDEPGVLATIGDDLDERTTKTWRIFSLAGGDYVENPADFSTGEGYWLYQRQGDDLVLKTGSGTSSDLTGTTLILEPEWNFIGSPYPFTVAVDADQEKFYGPLTYGLNGSEGWSDVVTELLPWGGYAIYNRGSASATILIDPLTPSQALTKAQDNEVPGWRLKIEAAGETYSDVGNYIGRLEGATEERDWFDNPEPPYIDGYVSLAMERPEWGNDLPGFTSDIRSLEEPNGVWDMDIHVKGESGPITLTSELKGDVPADFKVVLLDVITRQLHDLLDADSPVVIADYREEYPYHLKVVAGMPGYVDATVQEILAQLPTEFALSQNYPNPFNPSTIIPYDLPQPERIVLKVYNILGQEVVTLLDDWQDMGRHKATWSGRDRLGRNVASGVYIAVLRSPSQIVTRKMVLLK